MASKNTFLSLILHVLIILDGLYRTIHFPWKILWLSQHFCFWLKWLPALRSILSKRWFASHEAKIKFLIFGFSYLTKWGIFYLLLFHFIWWPWIRQTDINSPWLHRIWTIIFLLFIDNVNWGWFSDVVIFFFHWVLATMFTCKLWAYLIVILLFTRINWAYFLKLWVFILFLIFYNEVYSFRWFEKFFNLQGLSFLLFWLFSIIFTEFNYPLNQSFLFQEG